ncbi:MAG: 2,3-bisphosphoglycerate-independent phosphoglycerate mutase [Chloroflexia bacterium]|nr:2,3-bisphosphoglycerate-independent phosphoglycerate mutase [Chloroflexia bacterium]
MTEPKRPILLAILDGWGVAPDGPGNAVTLAHTPVLDSLFERYPHATLQTSGEAVGLPDGQMGNSEVGHLNIGAGFIVYQWITRLDKVIRDGHLPGNEVLERALAAARDGGGTVHLMGLVSDGGVHSHTRHLHALLDLAKHHRVERLLVHAFTDGRDTSPTSGRDALTDVESKLLHLGIGRIASVCGRYYAMDRDHRWERTALAFESIALGEGPQATSAVTAIDTSYALDVTDEFVDPTVIAGPDGSTHRIGPYDSIILFNFRSDRSRQLTAALSTPDFAEFDRVHYAIPGNVTTLTTYDPTLPVHVAFPPHDVEFPLARVISETGKTQFHSAETEKYPHVTFFLNGGREEPFPGEERRVVPSPKVATYDLQPEMSAPEVAAGVVAAIEAGAYDFIIVNFANCDMVGHTGVIPAAVASVEAVDASIGLILTALNRAGGTAIVTADHGNAEQMIDSVTGGPYTAHTTNPVPVILVAPEDSPLRHASLRDGAVLSAIAPTVLDLLGIDPPPSMDQPSLIGAPASDIS